MLAEMEWKKKEAKRQVNLIRINFIVMEFRYSVLKGGNLLKQKPLGS